jgi:hypothetical protein
MEEVKVEDWLKIWEKIGVRLLQLPKWMQQIVLEDINTAISNRLAVMEVIENVHRKNKD